MHHSPQSLSCDGDGNGGLVLYASTGSYNGDGLCSERRAAVHCHCHGRDHGYTDGEVAGCRCNTLLRRHKSTASAAITVPHTANVTSTTQPGTAPTLRSKNGRKFQVVM